MLNNTINTFELNKLLFLYAQGKDATLDFLQFPYKIVDNYVIVDNSEIGNLQYKLSTFEIEKSVQDSKIWILFTKKILKIHPIIFIHLFFQHGQVLDIK